MEFHPIAEVFPLIEGSEFEVLKEDIRNNGLREPIWTYEGKIIDGRNRYRACQAVSVEPRFQQWDGKGSLVAFTMSLNLHRRHLNAGQRAAVAVEIEPLLAEEAKERQRAAGDRGKEGGRGQKKETLPEIFPEGFPSTKDGEAREQAAKLTSTSGRYVQDAKKVKAKAPELLTKVKAGELTLPQAKAEVKRREKREQLQAKADVAEVDPSPQWEIRRGNVTDELPRVGAGSVRLVFADPPYNIGIDYGEGAGADRLPEDNFRSWCSRWVALCAEALAADGSMWVLINDEHASYFDRALQSCDLHRRAWVKWYETFGVCNSSQSNFSRTSRHLFYCVKDPKKFVWNADAVTRPSDRQTKYDDARANPGGKVWDDVWEIPRLVENAAERMPDFPTQLPLALLLPIVGCSSEPGDLVLDPFNGSGTTGVAALRLGRRYVGIEKSQRFADLATLRLKGESRG